MGNVEFFDELARKKILSNARMVPFDFEIYTKTFTDIDQKLKFLPVDSVLDLGGGTGQITALIAKKVGKVVLADGATEALTVAKEILRDLQNVIFKQVDLNTTPLPFNDSEFDKVVCYSVVHYLSNHAQFQKLVSEMYRITKKGGVIFVGDIPLIDKGKAYLENRRKQWFENVLGNFKYYFKKIFTALRYKIKGINVKQVTGLAYHRALVQDLLSSAGISHYKWVLQDLSLPFASSREDLLITKTI